MKKSQAIIVLVLIFVVSAGVGIAGSWLIKNMGGGDNYVAEETSVPSGTITKNNPPTTTTPSPQNPKGSKPKKDGVSTPQENKSTSPSKPIQIGDNGDSDKVNGTVLEADAPVIDVKVPSTEIAITKINGPIPNPETKTYSLSAVASGGRGTLTYYLYPARNAQDTLVNTTGIFTGLKSSSNGKYILLVKDQYGKECKKEITGFYAILNKLTTQQLTARISTSTPDVTLNKHFAKGYKIKFDGLKSGDPIPTGYTQIYSNIASGYWTRVKVTSVEYNDYNKITYLRISVYYN